jgi:hypothetical protein
MIHDVMVIRIVQVTIAAVASAKNVVIQTVIVKIRRLDLSVKILNA